MEKENPRFSDDNIAPLREPDIEKIPCKDCAFREADRLGGSIKGATLGICDKWGLKPYEIICGDAECQYYEKEGAEEETAEDDADTNDFGEDDTYDRVIGAIVGDIVGSRFEFHNHRSKNFELFTEKCRVTDDSIITLAICKALIDSDRDISKLSECAVKAMREVGQPYTNCGYGGRFRKWMYSDDPKPYHSYGNGAAMRVSPVAYIATSKEEAIAMSKAVTEVTHNHPEGIKGAEATAVATWMALNHYNKKAILAEMEKYYDLNFTLDEIRPTYMFNETCQHTVPQAIVCFQEAEDFEDTIRNAISIGGDSDTIAAIAGAIAGAYYGVPEDIEDEAREYLDDDLDDLLIDFMNFALVEPEEPESDWSYDEDDDDIEFAELPDIELHEGKPVRFEGGEDGNIYAYNDKGEVVGWINTCAPIMNTHKRYINLMEERFSVIKDENYESWVEYSMLTCGPKQYGNEAEMLEFLKENPDATLRETFLHFDEITPDGVGPGIDEAELLEDDENE